MAAGDLGIPMRLVLDEWARGPGDSVPVMLRGGVYVIPAQVVQVVQAGQSLAWVAELTDRISRAADAMRVFEMAMRRTLGPAAPTQPESGT